MGKKQMEVLQQMKGKFIDGCAKNGHDLKIAEKVWVDWEAFASYAFNKSHATCYAYVAFHTAYLKAHYPAEYMAAVLNAQINTEQIAFFMEECRRMGLNVMGPDINESSSKFTVTKKGDIRFGLGALKGVGEAAVENIVEERKNGAYHSIFDLSRRISLRSANRRVFEGLALGGAFDSFSNVHRAQYFHADKGDGMQFIEKVIKYGQNFQEKKDSSQASLFGEESEVSLPEPAVPYCEPWSNLEQLSREKEVIGMYISGHPLEDYAFEIKNYCRGKVSDLHDFNAIKGKELAIGAVVSNVLHLVNKIGKPYGRFGIEDQSGNFEISLFGEDYLKWKSFFMQSGLFVYMKVRAEEWRNEPGKFKLNILNMMLLSDVRNKMTKKLELSVNLHDLSDDFIGQLSKLIKKYPGDCAIQIKVSDPKEELQVELSSVKTKISLDEKIIEFIQKEPRVKYSLS
jgi:DNA polymerase-3 subunit alpha